MHGFVKIFLSYLWLQSEVRSAPRQPRLSVAESLPMYYYNHVNGNPEVYSFGYDVSDPETGNTQYRFEDRYPNGTVHGNYGYIDAYGAPQRYRYVADENGYRVFQDLPSTPSPILLQVNSGKDPIASSVTWTRPKRPNKKKDNKVSVTKLGEQRREDIKNPSYYASRYD